MRWRTADTVLCLGVIIAVAASIFTAAVQYITHKQLTTVLSEMRDAVVTMRTEQPAQSNQPVAQSTNSAQPTARTAPSTPPAQAESIPGSIEQPTAAVASNTNPPQNQTAGSDAASRLSAAFGRPDSVTNTREPRRIVSAPAQPTENDTNTAPQTQPEDAQQPASATTASASPPATPTPTTTAPTTEAVTDGPAPNAETATAATTPPASTPAATSSATETPANPEWAANRALVIAILRELFGGKHDAIMARIDTTTDFGRRVNKSMLERGLQKYTPHGGFAQLTEGATPPQVEPQPEARNLYRLNITLEDGHEVYIAITLNKEGQISTLTWRDGRG